MLYGTLATQQPAQQLFGGRSRIGSGSSSSTAVAAALGRALKLRKQAVPIC